MALSEQQILEHQLQRAEQDGLACIIAMQRQFEQAAKEMQQYAARYVDKTNSNGKSQVIGWAINYCASNVQGNLRLDVAAGRMSEINVFAAVLGVVK